MDRFFCALFRKSCLLQRFATSFRSMIIMMPAPCTQEVWRSARSLGNPRMDRFNARVQSPGVCTQSVMSTVVIRSNLISCQRTDHGCTKWCRRGDRKSAGRTGRPITFECKWYSCTHTVLAVSTRRALSFWIIPVRPMTPTWFWGSQTGPTETTLADGREWKCMHDMCISHSNYWLLCSILFLSVSYGQRCLNTNDGSFERRVVSEYNVYLHILCMIEPGKGIRFSSSVKTLDNMHLSAPSPQIHLRWTIDGR